MRPLSFLLLPFLCSLWVFPSAFSLDCNENQYPWPFAKPQRCCDKCPPGHFMKKDPDTSCNNECEPCPNNSYMENYTERMACDICEFCSGPNMERKSACSTTKNAVCGCIAGYRCKGEPCKACEQIPTTKATVPPSTTNVPPTPKSISQDTMWFLVITALLCAGIALVLVTRIRPFLRWLRSRHDILPEKAAVQPLSPEDAVSKPVQEVSCKCEQSIDLCVKV